MSGILSMLATIWKFQIVRFWDMITGNYLEIPDSSFEIKNAENRSIYAGISNGAILDRFVDANKLIVLGVRAGI
jgi:hypothetical protein